MKNKADSKQHIALISNCFSNLYDFRKELIDELLDRYHITIITTMEDGDSDNFIAFKNQGCQLVEIDLERRGTNPLKEFSLYNSYIKLLRNIGPDLVITYTIKPNIYAGKACKKLNIPYFSNITGLGSSIMGGGFLAKFVLGLYKPAIKGANRVFFQNSHNVEVFEKYGLISNKDKVILVPGSGVNLEANPYEELVKGKENTFLYIARIMKDKGADEFFYAAKKIKDKHQDVNIEVLGACEEDYENILNEYENQGIIRFHGWKKNVHEYLANAGCIVNPSYHEGMSNVCLEAAATGRAMITSDIPGCREINDGQATGYLCEARDKEALFQAMEKYYLLSFDEKAKLGKNAREKVVKEFDRKLVIGRYIEEIEKQLAANAEGK